MHEDVTKSIELRGFVKPLRLVSFIQKTKLTVLILRGCYENETGVYVKN